MFDEPDPIKANGPKLLDSLSVSELEEYVDALGREADRARAAIAAKKAHADAASLLFKPTAY